MKLEEIVSLMEIYAPKSLAEDFDNPGLITDGDRRDIKKVLVALDCTDKVAEEAAQGGYDMVITHHPLIFHPIKNVISTECVTHALYTLIRNGIALFAAHTNLDKAQGGVNDALCEVLGLKNAVVVEPENYGRVGELAEPMNLYEFTKYVDKKLDTVSKVAVAHFRSDYENIIIRKVGVLGGAGGDDIFCMKKYGADAYITGEMKHNQAIDAQHIGLNVLVSGHYETEKVILPAIIKYLQNNTFGVEYKLSEFEHSPLHTLQMQERS